MNFFKQFEYIPDSAPLMVQEGKELKESELCSDNISPISSGLLPFPQRQPERKNIAGECILEKSSEQFRTSNYNPQFQTMEIIKPESRRIQSGLSELYKSPHEQKEKRLKLLIVGHNPSHQSYSKGHYYANPVNRFWSLMRKAQLVPSHFGPNQDQDCPAKLSIGFTDLAWNFCETKSSNLTDQFLHDSCKADFYHRLIQHVQRVKADFPELDLEHCSPHIIAFTGIRQWKALFPANHRIQKASFAQRKEKRKFEELNKEEVEEDEERKSTKEGNGAQQKNLFQFIHYSGPSKVPKESDEEPINYGVQVVKPPDWPSLLSRSQIFILPSPSGAAAMSNEHRENPYLELGQLYQTLPSSGEAVGDRESSMGGTVKIEVIDMTLEED